MKFTYQTSHNSVNFLDLHQNLKDGAIFTDLHIKPTDGHQVVHDKSSHPCQIKNSIPYNQASRISRLCSSQNDFNADIFNLKDSFLARDYPQKVVSEQINKVVFGKQPTCKDTSQQGAPFVATYHPKYKDFGKLIKNLQLLLYSDSEVKRVFSPAPIVRSKLYPIERKVGSYRCGNSSCQVCTSIQVTATFCSFVTKSA